MLQNNLLCTRANGETKYYMRSVIGLQKLFSQTYYPAATRFYIFYDTTSERIPTIAHRTFCPLSIVAHKG